MYCSFAFAPNCLWLWSAPGVSPVAVDLVMFVVLCCWTGLLGYGALILVWFGCL